MCNFNKLINESTAQLEQLIATRYNNKWMLYFYKQRTSKTNSVIVFPICIAVSLTVIPVNTRENYEGVLFSIYLSKKSDVESM